MACYAVLCWVRLGWAVLRDIVLCCAVLCRAVPCRAVLCRAVLCRAVLFCAVSCHVMSCYATPCCNATLTSMSTLTRAAYLQDLPPNLLPFLRLGHCTSNEGLRQHGAFSQTSAPLPPAEEAQVLQNLASCIQQRLQRSVLALTCVALPAALAGAAEVIPCFCLYGTCWRN